MLNRMIKQIAPSRTGEKDKRRPVTRNGPGPSNPFSESVPESERSSLSDSAASLNGNISRLISAAVVDHQIRTLLLTDPAAVIETTYGGESLKLTPEERQLVLSIQGTTSLADFASQVVDKCQKMRK